MVRCPYCSRENVAGATTCGICGNALTPGTTSHGLPPATLASSNLSGNISAPQAQVFQTIAPPPAPTYQQPTSQQLASQPGGPRILPMGTKPQQMTGAISLRRAFAGHGVFLKHNSWLLPRNNPNEEVEAGKVLIAVANILRQRNTSFQLKAENLRESGFLEEERHYLIVQRRVSTVFIYVAPAGNDLYISRSTSVLCSISRWRVLALVLLVFAVFLPICILPEIAAAMAQGGGGALAAVGIAALLEPLLILISLASLAVLSWYLVRSFRYWLREKDSRVYLRTLYLKDFELDDIMLLEHATDLTIRAALEQLGMDASLIVPPSGGYQQDRRIRLL